MTKNESYSGIDYFRFIAALLIVAIHTSPSRLLLMKQATLYLHALYPV